MSTLPYKIVPLPDSITGLFLPGHQVTENYVVGLNCLKGHPSKEQLKEAVSLFQNEPDCSPCRGLALGNSGLALLQMEQTQEAIKDIKLALNLFEERGCKEPLKNKCRILAQL